MNRTVRYTYFGFVLIYFSLFWFRVISTNSDGNVHAFHPGIWADWAMHLTFGSSLAYRSFLLHTSPLLITAPFAYPLLSSWISAALIRSGVPFFSAFVFPSFVTCVFLAVVLYFFYQRLFQSDLIALMASLIFFCNGGLGFIYFFHDLASSSAKWHTILNLPRLYTHIDDHQLFWYSTLDSMIIPQRSLQIGLLIALTALLVIHREFFNEKQAVRRPAFLVALLIGILPIAHAHSFMAISLILCFWTISDLIRNQHVWQRRLSSWLLLAGSLSVIAVPLIKFFLVSNVNRKFMTWYPGWYMHDHRPGWLLFWWKNWGITLIASVAGLLYWIRNNKPGRRRVAALFIFLPFFVIFAVGNLILLQPWIWDNTKIFIWSSVGISGLAAVAVIEKFRKPGLPWKIAAAILFVTMICTGALDAYHLQCHNDKEFLWYSKSDMALADWVKSSTPAESVWLTSDKPNHWLSNLTGRQSVMGYNGWLWTHGYNFMSVRDDITRMFLEPGRDDLFQKYGIQYVVIGPEERDQWHANVSGFDERFKKIYALAETTIYTVRSSAASE